MLTISLTLLHHFTKCLISLFQILDPLLPFVANKTGPRRSDNSSQGNSCQGNSCQGNSCQGGACGYLEPRRQLDDQHPKYLELIDLTLPSLTDTSSTEG